MKLFRISLVIFALALAAPWSANAININTADIETLNKELSGVGKTRAEAIIAYRKKHGPFKSVDELINVEGIGHRTVESNRSKITLKSK